MKIVDLSKIFFMCIGILLGGVMFSVVKVMADLNPAIQGIPQVIPYQGILELNGQAVNRMGDQAMWIEFQIYDAVDAPNYHYSQRLQVEIYQGRFTALIGPSGQDFSGQTVYLTNVISASSSLYLGIVLLGDNLDSDDDDTNMSNRQRLMSTPYAMWASGASQFTVQQDLTVGGNSTVSGDSIVNGSLTVANQFTVQQNSNVNQNLTVNGQITTTGNLIAQSDINASGNVSVGTNLTVGNNVDITGELDVTTLKVNGQNINQVIRTWVREHCRIVIGHRDGEDDNVPETHITAYANNTCGAANNTHNDQQSECLGVRHEWAGLNTSGDVDGNDVFYYQFICD